MKKTIIVLIFILFWISSAYYVALTPNILNPVAYYTALGVHQLSVAYVILMAILTIVCCYLLVHAILGSIRKFLES